MGTQITFSVLGLVLIALSLSQGQIITVDLGALSSQKLWTASGTNDSATISVPAQVPGGIYSDLNAAGLIGEIYYRYNDKETRWVGLTNWTISRNFQLSADVITKGRVLLVCNGLDTIATVYINDRVVGSSDNMFVKYVFDIKDAVQIGYNTLRVEFQSPVEYAQKEWDAQILDYPVLPEGLPAEYQGEWHANHIRKMQASFSWDWGPSYPSSGIWKDIYIEAFDAAVMRDVMLFFKPSKQIPDETPDTVWEVTGRVYFDIANEEDQGILTMEIETESGTRSVSNEISLTKADKSVQDIKITVSGADVKLWWPNGYGNHPLYNFNLTFASSDGSEACTKIMRGGFRTAELVEDPIDADNLEKGLNFYFRVNGVPIYAKGTNSIPIHVLPERATREMTEWLFESAKEVNMNMIRVWGGGIYESESYYEFADENGIMVWEDFMFACAMYPTTPKFLESVRKEVETQVKRLQYHPSIVIWATNNENEAALRYNWYGTDINFTLYKEDYIKLYIDTIKVYVEELDHSRSCLPSSPTNGKQSEVEGWVAENPYLTKYGDVHFYNYKDDSWDWKVFPKTRFASEYGYQSWPSKETLLTGISEDMDGNWFSPMMYHRQHHPGGQEEIYNQIQMHLPMPSNANESSDFTRMLYLAQVVQSMGVKTQTEHYRRLKGQMLESGEGNNMGALYWQANDIWPGASWASIEFTGRWKLLQYYARNFFAPVIVSPYEIGNANGDIGVYLISDLTKEFSGNLRVRLFEMDNTSPLSDRVFRVTANPLSGAEVLVIKGEEIEQCQNVLSICFLHFSMPGTPDNFLFLSYPNQASFIQTPNLQVSSISSFPDGKTFSITLATDAITPFVFLSVKDNTVHGWFSDNGFIMISNTHTITYKSKETLSLEEFEQALQITSL